MSRRITQDARDLLADQFRKEAPKVADMIRDGFENFWVAPALRAIEEARFAAPAE